MSKFHVGDEVVIFNSISCAFEKDTVYGVLFVPVANTEKTQHTEKSIAERIEAGEMVVKEQCQTLQHQIVDADVLFASEQEARDFYISLLLGPVESAAE